MRKVEDQVFEFRAAIERNRLTYSLQHPYSYFAFIGILEQLDNAASRIATGRDVSGKTHVSLIPFMLIVQRQAMNAFESLATCRSYEAWVLVRPAIESALIVGKWLDNPEFAAVWSDRVARKTEYIKYFSGKGLISDSLPRSSELKSVLDRLNDEFIHANEPYYRRHLSLRPTGAEDSFLELQYFDTPEELAIHTLALLHLLVVLADSLNEALAKRLSNTGAYTSATQILERDLASRAIAGLKAWPEGKQSLEELGLWRGSF